MNTTRQDAWTKDEDVILAETVLRYIREGKTQLEAFKEVAEKLSRTSAACGFRWNATIRKQYQSAIQLARDERKRGNNTGQWIQQSDSTSPSKDSLEEAIILLKKLKVNTNYEDGRIQNEQNKLIEQLNEENDQLKRQLSRYHEAWREMGNLWKWVENKDLKS